MSKYSSTNLWFERAMTYRDRGHRAKALHALRIGRQCARELGDDELSAAFSTAMTLIAA